MKLFKHILDLNFKKPLSELNISQRFVSEIHEEKNSWIFVTKLAQFTESIFTQILVQRINEESTYNTISNLPQSVRLDLAFDLNLITKEQKFLFLTIAEIRNDYIHNISNFEVSLSDYLKTLRDGRIKEIYKRFKFFIRDEKIKSHEDFIKDCVNVIFTACILEILKVYSNMEGYATERKFTDMRARQAQRLLPNMADDSDYFYDYEMIDNYIKAAKNCLKSARLYLPKFPSKPKIAQ